MTLVTIAVALPIFARHLVGQFTESACFFFATGVSHAQRVLAFNRKSCARSVRKTTDAWGATSMIKLTRLDGEPFVLNAELIRYVERRPDTFITLTNGDRMVVGETMDEVVDRAVQYQQQKHFLPMPTVKN